MIVPGATRVEAGLDGAESKLTIGAGQELTESGEVRITSRIARCAGRVEVIAFSIRVPQFDQRPANRSAAAGEDAAVNVGYDARRDAGVVIELDKVIVLIERDVRGQRIIRPLRHS